MGGGLTQCNCTSRPPLNPALFFQMIKMLPPLPRHIAQPWWAPQKALVGTALGYSLSYHLRLEKCSLEWCGIQTGVTDMPSRGTGVTDMPIGGGGVLPWSLSGLEEPVSDPSLPSLQCLRVTFVSLVETAKGGGSNEEWRYTPHPPPPLHNQGLALLHLNILWEML